MREREKGVIYMCMSAPMPWPVKRSTTCRVSQHTASRATGAATRPESRFFSGRSYDVSDGIEGYAGAARCRNDHAPTNRTKLKAVTEHAQNNAKPSAQVTENDG